MARILSITKSGVLQRVHLDSGSVFFLKMKDVLQSGYAEGDEVDEDAFVHFVQLCQFPSALHYAVALLAKRAHSASEIRQKLLLRKYTQDVAELVILRLTKERLLDDRDFCEQWIRYRLSCRFGTKRILQELKTKGISGDLLAEAEKSIDSETEFSQAVHLAAKAWSHIRPGENRWKARQKVCASLLRRGYDWETARVACEQAEPAETE